MTMLLSLILWALKTWIKAFVSFPIYKSPTVSSKPVLDHFYGRAKLFKTCWYFCITGAFYENELLKKTSYSLNIEWHFNQSLNGHYCHFFVLFLSFFDKIWKFIHNLIFVIWLCCVAYDRGVVLFLAWLLNQSRKTLFKKFRKQLFFYTFQTWELFKPEKFWFWCLSEILSWHWSEKIMATFSFWSKLFSEA